MLLVQQPQHMPSAAFMPLSKQFNSLPSHRRNPSAPAAVVQGQVHPTKTPGLLSISKPAPIRQPRHATPRQHKSKPQPQQQQQPQGPSPERQRGRNNSAKDKSARWVLIRLDMRKVVCWRSWTDCCGTELFQNPVLDMVDVGAKRPLHPFPKPSRHRQTRPLRSPNPFLQPLSLSLPRRRRRF